jgi:predicted AAA+ superfamily ATPase
MKEYRLLDDKLCEHFEKYKQALILLGARQVGKTTILKKLFPDALYLLLDEKPILDILESYSSDAYKTLIGNRKRIFLDELHILSNPGRAVKLIYDQLPGIQIIVTGSSSLHIQNKTSESMAGRAINYNIYPLTFGEFLYQMKIEDSPKMFLASKIFNQDDSVSVKKYDIQTILQSMLLYGQYPHLVDSPADKVYLANLAEKAIFKDIIDLNLIENRSKALELLKLLAYQIGNLVSYNDLANRLGISTPTVQRYINIFEQSFIIYRLYPYSNNSRDEIGKAPKIYFWDLGLRNALINNFDNLNIRSDSGAMFENFIINELKKEFSYSDSAYNLHYWRLKSGSEVDLVISNHNELIGCEIKFSGGKVSSAFRNRYQDAKTHLISTRNFV